MQATRLRFIGAGDAYIAGVPQGELAIIAEPHDASEVTPAHAQELCASGLYEPADGERVLTEE